MKTTMSISVEQETVLALLEKMRQCKGQFTSKSHFIETAIKDFIKRR